MIQTAVAMAILMLVMSFGVEGLMKYQANSMPYSISAKVSAAVDSVQSATSSYIAQNSACMQNGLTGSGCNLSVSNLAPTYLPYFSGISGVNGNIFQTPDGSRIAITPTGQSTYTISVAPSGVLSSNANALRYLASSFPGGSVASGAVNIPETTPSIANMIASNKPAWGTLSDSGGSGATQSTNGGSLNTCGSGVCGQINSGAINANGQPINNVAGGQQFQPYSTCENVGCANSAYQIWAQPCSLWESYAGSGWATSYCGPWNYWPSGETTEILACGSGCRTLSVPGVFSMSFPDTGAVFTYWNTNSGATQAPSSPYTQSFSSTLY